MSDIIDINVGETIEEVTINVVDNLITVNINKVTGGGGEQTLAETLALGNVTDGENISISNGDAIVLDNGSMLKKGTIDAGNGGAKGISQICGVGYEHKWEAGRLYIMNDGGTIIREVSHNLTYTPTATDDVTKGFVQNTRWILDNGDVYLCTDPTEGAAVWELVNTGTTPTLQQVTTEGNETANPIKVIDTGNSSTQLQANGIVFDDLDDLGSTALSFQQNSEPIQQIVEVRPLGGTMALTSDIPDTSGFVPYTGASQNVDLGEYELKAGQVTLDTTPTGTAAVATTRWNDANGTSETTLKGGNVILKNGIDLVARVVNKVTPNTTLTKAQYQVVRVSGAQGQRLAVELAQANNDNNSADTLGIVTETIATNQEGFIMTVGQLEGINTTGSLQSETWADGDVLYLSATNAGTITNIKPTGATAHIVILGYVEYAHITQGKIYVKIMNGWELDELHNVYINTPLNNQALTYETSTQLWKNKTIIEDSITDGVTDKAPSQNSVFDALATKFTLPALTSGSVLFSNGSTIAQDNANLFWDNTNKRLGIGTNAPTQSLDVRGVVTSTTSLVGNMIVLNGANNTNLTLFNDSDGRSFLTVKGNTSAASAAGAYFTADGFQESWFNVIARGASLGNKHWRFGNIGSGAINNLFAIQKLNDAGNAITSTALAVFSSTSNVGINTTIDVGFRLDVNGTTRLNGNTSIGGGTAGARLDVRAQGALSTDIAFRVRNSADSANLVTVQGNGVTKIGTTVFNDPNSNLIIGIDGATSARGAVSNNSTYQDFLFVNTSIGSGNINSWSFGQRRDTAFGNTLGSFQIVGAYINNAGAASAVGGGFRVPLICNPNGDVIIAGATANAVNGNVLIGTTTPSASAKVLIDSTTQGFLPPRMTTTEKNAIASPAAGLVVYDSTLGKLCVRTASAWETITSV